MKVNIAPIGILYCRTRNLGRQIFVSSVVSTNISNCLYERCPKVNCKSRVIEVTNGLFRCNKCEVDYLVQANGIRRLLEVGKAKDNKTNKRVVLFNENASKFLNTSATRLNQNTTAEMTQLKTSLLNTSS